MNNKMQPGSNVSHPNGRSPVQASARTVSIRNATVTGENPLSPTRAPPPKPMRTARSQPRIPEDEAEKGSALEMKGQPPPQPHIREQSLRGSIYAKVPVETPPTPVEERVTSVKASDVIKGRFSGKQILQFGLWGYYMNYGSAFMLIVFGIFGILFDNASFYECKIGGDDIYAGYILNDHTGNCTATYTENGILKTSCCDPDFESTLEGSVPLGSLFLIYGILLLIINNDEWGFGLWYPTDLFTYDMKLSPLGILHIMVGIAGLAHYSTCIAAVCLIANGVVLCIAAKRKEAGDGGREYRARQREIDKEKAAAAEAEDSEGGSGICAFCGGLLNPVSFFKRIYNQDKLASYFWMSIYVGFNIALFIYTLDIWIEAVHESREDLKYGRLRIDCNGPGCQYNRKLILYGPLSGFAPWAKACGNLLNFNCALILIPVTKMLLTKINNFGVSASSSSSFFTRVFSHPLTRYIPLSKNIDFHIIIAIFVFCYAVGHTLFHVLNLVFANDITIYRFADWGWEGTDLFTGE